MFAIFLLFLSIILETVDKFKNDPPFEINDNLTQSWSSIEALFPVKIMDDPNTKK